MKLKKIFPLGLLITSLFTGCSSTKSQNKNSVFLQLDGNPTTGYTWFYDVDDDSVVDVTEKIEQKNKDPRLVGGSSFFYYTFTPKKVGKTFVHFEYKRSWEKDSVTYKHRYEVIVNEKGEISMRENENGFISISMSQGLEMKNKLVDSVLLDVRRPDEFSEGHIPGAIQMTNEEMTKIETEKILPNKNQIIFVYCRSGRRSKQAAEKLASWGYSKIYEIGGILDYTGTLEK